MKIKYQLALMVVLLLLLSSAASAQGGNSQPPNNPATSRYILPPTGLGVYLRPVPAVLAHQLSALIPAGQGLLVRRVKEGSAAAIAGIQRYDVLLSLDDQKLFSPGQLTQLLATASADKTSVTLQLIRQAQLLSIGLDLKTLQHPQRQRREPFSGFPFSSSPRFQQPLPGWQPPASSLAWDSFESVKVNTLADGRYHAEVSFKDRNNNSQSFTFEGYKDDIIRQIEQQAELPADKREALLNALNMRADFFIPNLNNPSLQHNPFNHPFFRTNPFDDPFFRNGFFAADPAGQGTAFTPGFLPAPPWHR